MKLFYFPGANRSAANSELLAVSPTELKFTPKTKHHLDTIQTQRVFGEEQSLFQMGTTSNNKSLTPSVCVCVCV